MAEGISISLAEVSAAAASLRSTNTSLGASLQSIKQTMNNLSSTWQSEAGDTIRSRFNALEPKFENYREVVDSYAKFLDNTVANYEATESSINSAASNFK